MVDQTSWFQDQGLKPSPRIIRKFVVGSTDYSDRVLKWPTVTTDASKVRPGRLSVDLANHDQVLNQFTEDKTNLVKPCLLQFGYAAEGADYTEQQYERNQPAEEEYYSSYLSMTGSGDYLAIGISGSSSSGANQSGAIEILKRRSTRFKNKLHDRWTSLHHIYDPLNPVAATFNYFGVMMDFSEDGNYLFVGQQNYIHSSQNSAGIVYVYEHIESRDNPDILNGEGVFSLDTTNIVKNGAFTDNASHWVDRHYLSHFLVDSTYTGNFPFASPLSVNSGVLKVDVGANSGYQIATQYLEGYTKGRNYELNVDLVDIPSGQTASDLLAMYTGNLDSLLLYTYAGSAFSFNTNFRLDHYGAKIGLYANGNAGYTEWGNVSIKESYELIQDNNFLSSLIFVPQLTEWSITGSSTFTTSLGTLLITQTASVGHQGVYQGVPTSVGSSYTLKCRINSGNATLTNVSAHTTDTNPQNSADLLKLTGVTSMGVNGTFTATTTETFVWLLDGQTASGDMALFSDLTMQHSPGSWDNFNSSYIRKEAGRMRVINNVTRARALQFPVVTSGEVYVLTGKFHSGTSSHGIVLFGDATSSAAFDVYSGTTDFEIEHRAAQSNLILFLENVGSPGPIGGEYNEWSDIRIRLASDRYAYKTHILPDSLSLAFGGTFGRSVSANEDGSVLAVGAPLHITDAGSGRVGSVFVFAGSDNGTWNQVKKLEPTTDTTSTPTTYLPSSGNNFGWEVKMSPNGLRVITISPEMVVAGNQTGWGIVYAGSSNNNWAYHNIFASADAHCRRMGYGGFWGSRIIASNYDGTHVAIGSPLTGSHTNFGGRPDNINGGAVYLFTDSNGVYKSDSNRDLDNPTSEVRSGGFRGDYGISVFMSHSADVLIVADDFRALENNFDGQVYTYRRSPLAESFLTGGFLNYDQSAVSTLSWEYPNVGNAQFGYCLQGSKYGKDFVVGVPFYNPVGNQSLSEGRAVVLTTSFSSNSFSAAEMVTLYRGTVDNVNYRSNNTVRMSLQDRLKTLKDSYMGTDDSPVTFTDSTLPQDIAWTACTCYGGLSSIESTSNPDIDYDAFIAWGLEFDTDNIYMNGEFKGVRALEVISKIARMTDSSVAFERDKLFFRRWSTEEGIAQDFNIENSTVNQSIAAANLINDQTVLGGYDTSVQTYGIAVSVVDAASTNSFGNRSHNEKDSSVWYVDSSGCTNLAQRKVFFNKTPSEKIAIQAYLPALSRRIGDTISTTNSAFGHENFISRMFKHSVNMDSGKVNITSDPSIVIQAFRLDVTALDSTSFFLA